MIKSEQLMPLAKAKEIQSYTHAGMTDWDRAMRTIIKLADALEYSNAALRSILKSDYETKSNKEPWLNEEAWVQADELLRAIGAIR